MAAAVALAMTAAVGGTAFAGQGEWRWCSKCQGLWYAANGTDGRCPAGNGHFLNGSLNYQL